MHRSIIISTLAGLLAAALASADCNCIHGLDKALWVDAESPSSTLNGSWGEQGAMISGTEKGELRLGINNKSDKLLKCFITWMEGQQTNSEGAWSLWSAIKCTDADSIVDLTLSSPKGTISPP